MSDELQQLEHWLAPLLARLQPAQRRQLARDIARELRADNARAMRAQQGPDGQTWEPRKRHSRDQRGKLRQGPMFTRLRAAKHLKARASSDAAVVQFMGRAERIARVHHFGLRDRVKPGGPLYDYPARPLLGITPAMRERIEARVLEHLARA